MSSQFINMRGKQCLEITGIEDSKNPDVVIVILKSTGKPANLAKKYIDFLPGCVVVPDWLADRLKSETKSNNFYVKEFLSDECQCGRPKRPRHSFCFKCYKRLPVDMQKDLWQRFGFGYESAYDAAYKYLND